MFRSFRSRLPLRDMRSSIKSRMLAGAGVVALVWVAVSLSLRSIETGEVSPQRGIGPGASGGRDVDAIAASRPSLGPPVVEAGAHRITAWLSDPAISPDDAARELWRIASDRNEKQSVRDEALAHALNLTGDAAFLSEVVPSLSEEGVWPGSLGLALLADIYDRPREVQIPAAIAMLPLAAAELHEELRELLEFLVGDERAPELDDGALIEFARNRSIKELGSDCK